MICIYHNRDLDGFSSAAIVADMFPNTKLIGFDYGMKLNLEDIPPDEAITMVDISLPISEMIALAKHSGWKLTWIDHHISAINDYKAATQNSESFCIAVLENGRAACELTWDYFHPNISTPEGIRLLGEYDTWRNQDLQHWENRILPFQYGMRLICNSPETFPLEDITGKNSVEVVHGIIKDGEKILKYQSQIDELLCRKASFVIDDFHGLRAICLNGSGFSSNVFKSVYDEDKHDLMMPFQFDGNQWTVSLYTTKEDIDCSVLAKLHGGGGHKKAAGFQVYDIRKIIPQI